MAIHIQLDILESELLNVEYLSNLAFDPEDILELQTRAVLRTVLPKMLEKELHGEGLRELLTVLFEVTYPTPPIQDASIGILRQFFHRVIVK